MIHALIILSNLAFFTWVIWMAKPLSMSERFNRDCGTLWVKADSTYSLEITNEHGVLKPHITYV